MNYKLNKLKLNTQSQANEISLQAWISNTLTNQINAFQPKDQLIQKSNTWNSAWTNINMATPIGGGDAMWYNWILDIGQLDLIKLNDFKIEILLRNGEDANGDSSWFEMTSSTGFKKWIGWDIKDLESNPTSTIKNIKLVVSFYYDNGNLESLFQCKLLVQYMPRVNRE